MGERVKGLLAYCGKDVTIHPLAKICKPEVVALHDHCTIGDYAFIWGGEVVSIGRHSHIQVHVSIWGGGKAYIGDYVSVGLHSVLLTAVYDHRQGLRMVDHLPEGQTKTLFGELLIGKDVYIGANCTILPVTIGEGAIVGAGSLVNKDLDPWGIYVGSPCRKIGERRGDKIMEMVEEL
jgi:galactoside O-acetyltransferase